MTADGVISILRNATWIGDAEETARVAIAIGIVLGMALTKEELKANERRDQQTRCD